MRLALVGAFPFPLPQGSQVYVAEQRAALARAGATPVLLTYGGGWLGRIGRRSGPSLAKPLADAALLAGLLRANARERFDAVLAHNAEAAVVAIACRALTGVPVVYVAHTVLAHELSAYGPDGWRGTLDRLGGAIDAWIARRADGVVALSEDARADLLSAARCPVEVLPPGLEPRTPPAPADRDRACRAAGVEPGRFVLYAGNLDGYQDLALLDAAAGRCHPEIPFVVATHDARDGAVRFPGLRIVERGSFDEVRALQHAAGALVLTRRRRGGFPIKLLNYMEAGRPIVAFRGLAPGLVNGVSARLLETSAGPGELAAAIRDLFARPQPELGRAAREHLVAHHGWDDLARRTLAFAEKCVAARAALSPR